MSGSTWSPLLRGPSLVPTKAAPPEGCFCSICFGCISSACTCPSTWPVPSLVSVPSRDWGAVEGGGFLAPGDLWCHLSACIHAILLYSYHSPALHLPMLHPGQVAQWCAGGCWFRGLGCGVKDTASRPQFGHGRGCSPAPRRSLPINKRFPSSLQLCTAAACSPPSPLCPRVAMETAIQRPGTSRLPSSPGGPGRR